MPSLLFRTSWLVAVLGVLAAACSASETAPAAAPATTDPPAVLSMPDTTAQPSTTVVIEPVYFTTIAPGSALPTGADCARQVLGDDSNGRVEVRPENAEANAVVVDVAVSVDGADEEWNGKFASRISGDFVGTTDQILRWGACKWGFDEDVTRARAVTESSWRMSTAGDETNDATACERIGRTAPCAQSFGLLQVKASVHEGTYPATLDSTSFGVDYAMAWLRACYEGTFVWLAEHEGNDDYRAGDELGCVGVWFSGNWWDPSARDYIAEVEGHLAERTWDTYSV